MKRVLIVLSFFFSLMLYAQDITVVEKDNKKTLITIETKKNRQIPIFKILSESTSIIPNYQGTLYVNNRNLELIGNAPMTLEVNNGYYEFQMYQSGNAKFHFETIGVDQKWLLKEKGKYGNLGLVLGGVGILGSLGSLILYSHIDFEKNAYKIQIENYQRNPYFYDNPGKYSGTEYYMAHSLLGVSVSAVVTGVITWIVNQPSAKQIE